MKELGWGLFLFGALVLAIFALIGVDPDGLGLRVTNLAALAVGSTMMISGAVFAAAGTLSEAGRTMVPEQGRELEKLSADFTKLSTQLSSQHDEMLKAVGIPDAKMPKITQKQTNPELYNSAFYANRKAPTAKEQWEFLGKTYKSKEEAEAAYLKYYTEYSR